MQVEYLKACYSSGYRYPTYNTGYTSGYNTGYNTGYPTYTTGYTAYPTYNTGYNTGYTILPTTSGYAYNPYGTTNVRYPY